METQMVRLSQGAVVDTELAGAVEQLKAGKTCVFPTETVYGLGANALDSSACLGIYEAKGRPADNPLICHISSRAMLSMLVDEEETKNIPFLSELFDTFWPGPLTVLLPRKAGVPDVVTAGLPTVGVRLPAHPVAARLIELCGFPIAAPSANRSGRPSPTTAEHVWTDLRGRVPIILDGGACQLGVESTVVTLTSNPPLILRPGGATLEQLRRVIPNMEVFHHRIDRTPVHGSPAGAGHSVAGPQIEGIDVDKPPTPGMKYQHYAPTAVVTLFEGTAARMGIALATHLAQAEAANKVVGIIHTQSSLPIAGSAPDASRGQGLLSSTGRARTYVLGDEHHPGEVAHGIFAALRALDETGVDYIFIQGITEDNEGMAVMNRVRKAATTIVQCDV